MDSRILAHKSSQTGDTLHVAGALAFDARIHVIVVHAGDSQTTKELLKFYRQVTDPAYPHTDIEPDSAYTNQRVKAVYASTEKAAKALYDALSTAASDTDVQAKFTGILDLGDLSYETKDGTAPPASKQIENFTEFKVCGRQFLFFEITC